MKNIIPISIMALAMAACSSPQNKNNGTDTIASSTTVTTDTVAVVQSASAANSLNGTQRFIHTEGKAGQDSTSIILNLQGNTVSGQMNWTPHEKDSRKGTLKGTRSGDMIDATWTFMQEGMTDTLNLQFKLQNSRLLQKPLKFDPKTGRQQTDEAAGYSIVYRLEQ